MKYFKLFLISIIVFSVVLFFLSLVFPSTTYVSRAVNVKGMKSKLNDRMLELYSLAFMDNKDSSEARKSQVSASRPKNFRTDEMGEFVSVAYETYKITYGDTLSFNSRYSSDIQQAVSIYEAGKDSTTVQVFYKINVPFYKPWKKFALMLNETKYGPSLDSAISRISQKF